MTLLLLLILIVQIVPDSHTYIEQLDIWIGHCGKISKDVRINQ